MHMKYICLLSSNKLFFLQQRRCALSKERKYNLTLIQGNKNKETKLSFTRSYKLNNYNNMNNLNLDKTAWSEGLYCLIIIVKLNCSIWRFVLFDNYSEARLLVDDDLHKPDDRRGRSGLITQSGNIVIERLENRNRSYPNDLLSHEILGAWFQEESHSFVTHYPLECVFQASPSRRSSNELTRYKPNWQIGEPPSDMFFVKLMIDNIITKRNSKSNHS